MTTPTEPAVGPAELWPTDPATRDAVARQMVEALSTLLESRPNFKSADYGDRASYRAETRRATADLRLGRALLAEVRLGPDLSELLASQHRRIEFWGAMGSGGMVEAIQRAEYTAGQYYCVEYRAAVVGMLASVAAERFARQYQATGPFSRANVSRMAKRYGRRVVAYL